MKISSITSFPFILVSGEAELFKIARNKAPCMFQTFSKIKLLNRDVILKMNISKKTFTTVQFC